jgi:hypothetical protein
MSESLSFGLLDEEIEAAVEEIFCPNWVDKGAGFCQNSECFEFCKPKFIWRHEGPFFCEACTLPGEIVPEVGKPSREPGQPFGEVRVEFSYCPSSRRFREIAIVRDELLAPSSGVYTLQMPTVVTERRALRVAELTLLALNEVPASDEELVSPPYVRETVLDICMEPEKVQEWLRNYELRVKDNPLFQEPSSEVVSQRSGKT